MNETVKSKIGSTIYERINSVRMSDAERVVALNAMRDAELIVDAITWIGRKFEQLGGLFTKPSLKPSLKS
jgi:single-stranded DNA-specific DHH superfamily exonuclease